MSRTPTTFNRLAPLGLAMALAIGLAGGPVFSQERTSNRVERPEGYLVLEGDAGPTSRGKGSFSVVPASKHEAEAPAEGTEEGPADSSSEDQYPPPPPPKTARELCQPQAERFARRLAALRGNPADGGEALDPAVQRAMFGRTALHAGADTDQPVPELTWDDELKDLHRALQKCLKAQRQR